jgi:glutathione S-transferase|tara:strand:+ start:12677 stop:13396 length:720 start_codon:yes stop_codon:yes gene_type:complete
MQRKKFLPKGRANRACPIDGVWQTAGPSTMGDCDMDGLTLYDHPESGNGHKVRLLLSLLNIDYTLVFKDIHKGETRTPEFLALNPAGRIPVLQLADNRTLPESNAILWYLAEGTGFIPTDRWERARVLAWMMFEQYQHEPTVAVARFWCHHLEMTQERKAQLAEKHVKGYEALAALDTQLLRSDWLVGSNPSIADIALYSYTSVAQEGGFDLSKFTNIQLWLDRIAALPGFIPMEPWTE